jgi:hypothetical protein
VLAAVAVGAWQFFFPNPQKLILKRLARVAELASFRGNEALASRLLNVRNLVECFSPNVQIHVGIEGTSERSLEGRPDLQQAILLIRSTMNGLVVEFVDMTVEVAPDRQTATASMTLKASVPGEKDLAVQELKMKFEKIDGEWLISRVESVKTLSLPEPQ